MPPIKTISEALAQRWKLPERFDDQTWRSFAAQIDGYAIAEELGFDLRSWAAAQEQAYQQRGRWELNPLELRLMIFYQFRADYMSGYTYHERDELVDSLMAALGTATGQPYQRMGS
ncbi:MAG TPA: hypothetical protein VFZ66_18425 [Herpetosiphonaceae bacterium]